MLRQPLRLRCNSLEKLGYEPENAADRRGKKKPPLLVHPGHRDSPGDSHHLRAGIQMKLASSSVGRLKQLLQLFHVRFFGCRWRCSLLALFCFWWAFCTLPGWLALLGLRAKEWGRMRRRFVQQ